MYAAAAPSSTLAGPDRLTVIGSLAAIVAVALEFEESSDTRPDRSEAIAPRVTVNVSEVSDSMSSATAIAMVVVAPAAELAAKVAEPDAGE